MVSKRAHKSVTQLVEEFVSRGLASEETHETERTYHALKQLEGFVKRPRADASKTIDRVLYGEHGRWRGEPGTTGVWTLPEYNHE